MNFGKIKTAADLEREERLKERNTLIANLLNEAGFQEFTTKVSSFVGNEPKPVKKRKRNSNRDATFHFQGAIPVDTRKSRRLQNKTPDDLVDMRYTKMDSDSNDDDYKDLEDVLYKPKKARTSSKKLDSIYIFPVEEVTEEMINNIARKVKGKQYSETGTTCHQCRQKTKDQKTYCRNANCVGMRGQFCGVCLQNRYGEDAAVALRDPSWHCPVCRGICNCSFCRMKEGKRPTGILAPLAFQQGHKSVKEFLENLRGFGDYAKEQNDPKKLLGFSQDLNYAHMGGGVQHYIGCNYCHVKK